MRCSMLVGSLVQWGCHRESIRSEYVVTLIQCVFYPPQLRLSRSWIDLKSYTLVTFKMNKLVYIRRSKESLLEDCLWGSNWFGDGIRITAQPIFVDCIVMTSNRQLIFSKPRTRGRDTTTTTGHQRRSEFWQDRKMKFWRAKGSVKQGNPLFLLFSTLCLRSALKQLEGERVRGRQRCVEWTKINTIDCRTVKRLYLELRYKD